MKLTYHRCGDYLLPDLGLDERETIAALDTDPVDDKVARTDLKAYLHRGYATGYRQLVGYSGERRQAR